MLTLPLEAGKLSYWATLLAPSLEDDGNEFNEPSRARAAVAGFWCDFESVGGGPYLEAGRSGARITVKLTARWRADVGFGLQIAVNDMLLNVERVAPAGQREAVEIFCSEAKAG